MATIIGGFDTGLLDSSLYQLNRNDRTRTGVEGHEEELYVNVSNGNLIIRHLDAFLPSEGEDFTLLRTYNSRGSWNQNVGQGWAINTIALDLSQITSNMITLINADSSRFLFTPDATGVFRSVDGPGAYETITQNKSAKTFTLVQSDQSVLTFDGNGNLLQSQDTNGNLIQYLRQAGKITQIKDDTGHVINYIYSGQNLSQIADEFVQWRLANGFYQLWDPGRYTTDPAYAAQANAIRLRHTTLYTYNAHGELLTVTEPRNFTTHYQYDALENLITVIDANADAITQSDDPYFRDLRRDFGYVNSLTGQGKLVSELTASDIAALQERFTTHLEYDGHGNLIKRTDNADNVTRYTYTPFNKLATQTAAMGNALVTSDDAFYQDKRKQLGYIDPTTGAGKLVAQLTAAEIQAILALFTASYSYDAKQNLIEIKSPGGDLTRFTYDSFGNRTKKTVFLDQTDLVTLAKQQITQYFYDAFGNNIKSIDAEGNTTFASFDHFGNRTSFTDGRSGVTTYTYDNDNRLLTVTDPEGHVTVNSYDSVGNRISVKDANGHSVIYVYDRNNMLITVTDPSASGNTAQDRVTRYAYDVVDNRTSATDAEGRTTTYLYREDNRLLTVTTPVVTGADGLPTQ